MVYLIPVLGAFIGFISIYISIKLVFKRVLPGQQQRIAQEAGAYVANKVFSFDDIKSKLNDPAQIKALIPLVETHIDHFLRVKLPAKMPVISMFIGDSIVNQMKATLVEELDNLFPQLINQYLGKLEGELNVQQLVTGKIAAISIPEMETAVYNKMGSAFNRLYFLGAGIGLLIGLLQLLIALSF
ncbi:hypothetical protein LX64_02436 [Chitinophaga skermanii]|uniref:DUF445 family protein n=1 Tax=Chitinophaga skermanii TaxID=331697 RepID=A0A327QLZ7_9BACT|nr:hypothetical protein [Chitinophaga skermanii]RAJ05281.1 hypothetical protein LX64_02436 [Chitinophaga skermanii]